jgi:hypothetical protein
VYSASRSATTTFETDLGDDVPAFTSKEPQQAQHPHCVPFQSYGPMIGKSCYHFTLLNAYGTESETDIFLQQGEKAIAFFWWRKERLPYVYFP